MLPRWLPRTETQIAAALQSVAEMGTLCNVLPNVWYRPMSCYLRRPWIFRGDTILGGCMRGLRHEDQSLCVSTGGCLPFCVSPTSLLAVHPPRTLVHLLGPHLSLIISNICLFTGLWYSLSYPSCLSHLTSQNIELRGNLNHFLA